jgi:general secretion pathway protein K
MKPVFSEAYGDSKGMALLITVTVITVVIAAGIALNRSVREAATTSTRNQDRLTLMQMAASGVHGAMAVLSDDRRGPPVDSVQEDWADPQKTSVLILSLLNLPEGNLRVTITDELARIQVNALVEFPGGQQFNMAQMTLWNRFLSNEYAADDFPADGGVMAVINAIKDWIDKDDGDAVTGLTGAESEYYLTLDPPYACPNAPMLHVFELSRVKGISENLFFDGSNRPGLVNTVSVFGEIPNTAVFPGKININTAPRAVLAALLPPEHSNQAQRLVDYREEKGGSDYLHDLSQPNWYKEVPGFGSAEIDPKLITLSSDLFRIESEAFFHAMALKVTSVVRREKQEKTGKWACKILSWNSSWLTPSEST